MSRNNNKNGTTLFDCDISNPECYSLNTSDPWETDYAALVPRFTGGISAISSTLIIYVILRSETRLSSIYHRIMFGMSLADISGSIAMALTTLPMPSYMPKEEIFGYNWTGTRLGNEYTCNTQGFFAFFGMTCMFNYNAMLCVYYACAIAFTMREKHIQKYVEPVLHGFPIAIGLALALPPLFYEMYNPGITAYPWCGPFPYPDECAVLNNVECIRGSAQLRDIVQFIIPATILLLLLIIIVPLVLVIYKIIQTDRILDQIPKVYENGGNGDLNHVIEKHRSTKAALIQAISYIVSFLLGFIPPFIISLGMIDSKTEQGKIATVILSKLYIFFIPLQGFFNCIIFISHKVYNYRRVHNEESICSILGKLFCTSVHDPYFISRISIVKQHEAEEEEEYIQEMIQEMKSNIYDFEIQDESNQEFHFRLGLMKSCNDSGGVHDAAAAALEKEVEEDLVVADGAGDDNNCLPSFPSHGDLTAVVTNDAVYSPLAMAVKHDDLHCQYKDESSSPSYGRGFLSSRAGSDSSDWISYPSRSSLNISVRDTDFSFKEGHGDDHRHYYRNVNC